MRRLFLVLAVLSIVLPASAQMRGGGRAGFAPRGHTFGPVAPRVASSGRGPIIRTVPPIGRFGFRHSRFGPFSTPSVFSCQRNPAFCDANGIPFNTTFINGRPFFGSGFFNGFGGFGSFGGYGAYVVPPGYYDQPSVADSDHVLRYREDPREGVIDDLMFQLRDQQRELDYLMNNQQRSPDTAPQQQGPAPRGSLLRQQSPGSAANSAPSGQQQPATTLVFKDGRRTNVYNYAIAKGTLTVLDNGTRQRIPLSQLDIPATQKANEDRGVTFKAPTATVSLMCNPADPDFECRQHQAQAAGQGNITRR